MFIAVILVRVWNEWYGKIFVYTYQFLCFTHHIITFYLPTNFICILYTILLSFTILFTPDVILLKYV
jgi:hypothetical protein